jgi:RNA polymerase sigma factor (sigma-70 family)
MHNIVIDQGRLKRRQVAEIRLAEGHDDRDPRSADPTAAVELRPALFGALRTLTPHQREIVVLRYFDDRSESEVAELLGVAPGTVRSTLSRAVAQLREHPSLSGLFTPAAANPMTRRVRYA